jgi:predicted transcriptional regulator
VTIVPRVTRRGSRLDWVKFDFDLSRDGSVDPTDKALYAAIASFVDLETRESPETIEVDLNVIPDDVPTRKRLAKCIGRSVDTVDRATKRLEDRGLLRVHRQADPDNPKVMLPSEYELLDHEIWDRRAAERAAAREARRQGGSRMDAATPGRASAATPGRMDAAVKEVREVEEEKRGEKTPDVRRTASSGSSGQLFGGSAAFGKTNPPCLTRGQRQQVDAFFAALPKPLADLVPDNPPSNLKTAVLEALAADKPEARTPQQLVDYRLMPKWDGHYARRDQAGPLERPVGVLIAMLTRDAECGDPRCDERKNVDTGQACRSCEVRREDKRADRATERPAEAPLRAAAAPAPRTPARKPQGPVPPPREAPMTEVSGEQRSLARQALLNRTRVPK